MTFERAFALSSVLLAAVACSGLLFAQSLPLWLALPTAFILILSLLQAGGAPVVRLGMAQAIISPALSNVLSIGAFAVFLADLILFSRDLLPAGIHFLVLLLNIKLLTLQQRRDYRHLYALSLMAILASASVTTDAWYVPIFLLYLLAAVWTLLLYHMTQETGPAMAGGLPAQPAIGSATGPSRVTAHFCWLTNGVVAMTVGMTLAIFFIIPRVGVGALQKTSGEALRTSGFSERVDLGTIGSVKQDPQVVMRVELPDRSAVDNDRLYLRGLAYDQVRAKVYFPFTRFGEHIVVARQMIDGAEKDREVSAFESPLEAQQFATLMKARGWKVKQTMAKEYSRDSDGAASKAVREILNIVNGIDETTDSKHQLLDAINQTFINSLPDMSYAKHFTHAKDVKGFSKDALRAFAHSAMHGAHHISRIKNADRLTGALVQMDERINATDEGDVTEARQVHNELTLRHNGLLDPNTSPVAAWLGQLGFTMSLGGVVATGVTNMTQVPLITFPWLGSRYGFGKAGAHLARAYKDFLDPATLNADSLFDASQSKRVTEGERAMLKELQRRGRIDLTQTMDLSGRASQDNISRVAKQHGSMQDRIGKMLGFTFHAPEVMNRQVTALATYRMEMTRNEPNETPSQKQTRAINRAETAIIDTHFIYTQENRPRYMSGNVMRVLTMFKQYGQNVAFLYGRSAQLWLTNNQATADERAIAKKQLLSMASLQFAAAGALGMPFVGTVASLFTAILNGFGDDDDKKDWEVELRKYLAEAVGKEAGEVLSHGASRLTPWDMAARLGQSDLFFRAPQREREGRAGAMDWVTSLSGPVLGYAVNAYLSVGDMMKGVKSSDGGHFLRGVEEMAPAVVRNGLKALRFEMEGGIQSRDHHQQLDVDGVEKLGQFFGFAPSRGAEMYEGMTAIKNLEHRLTQRRGDLLDAYAAAYQSHDRAQRQAVLDDVRAFNAKHRELAINGDTLMRSLKGWMKREHDTVGGVYLPPKRAGIRQEGAFANY